MIFNMELIRGYTSDDRALVEEFRNKTFAEGNTSLRPNIYDPDDFNGQTFLFFVDDQLASISAVESSLKYTDETDTCRICRYHILKQYRHCNAGFKMLPYNVNWAKDNGYNLIYWTHDVNNRALNAMYQHKRRMPNKANFFEDPLYKSFQLVENLRFITGDVTQYVYAKYLTEDYVWSPKGKMIQVPV